MSIKDRLIQFVLRGKDELSPEAKKSAEALEKLKDEAARLGKALDDAKAAQGLAKGLENTRRAAEQSERALVQADLQIKELRDALNKNPEGAGLAQSLKDAEREGRRLQRQLDGLNADLARQEKAARAAGVNTDQLGDEHQRLTAELAKAQGAVKANTDELKALEREQAKAARGTAEHASRVDASRAAMSRGAKQVLAFAAAYLSLNAAFGLIQSGLNKVRDGIYAMLATGDEFAKLDTRMASLMGSVAAGEQATKWIKQFAKDTPLELRDVTEAFALMKSYGLDPMDGSLQAIVDKNEQMGGGMERLSGLASALGQAYAKQKLQTEEILQLVERGVPVWELLEKVTGKNVAQLQELASKGQLGRDVIAKLIAEIGNSAKGAAAANMTELSGLVSTLSDTWTDFLNRIAKAGALDSAKQRLKAVADTIDEMDKDGRLDRIAKSLSEAFERGAEAVSKYASKLADVDYESLAERAKNAVGQIGETVEQAKTAAQLSVATLRTVWNAFAGTVNATAAALMLAIQETVGRAALAFGQLAELAGNGDMRRKMDELYTFLGDLSSRYAEQAKTDFTQIAQAWDFASDSAANGADKQSKAVDKATGSASALAFALEQTEQAAVSVEAASTKLASAFADLAEAQEAIAQADTAEEFARVRVELERMAASGALSTAQYNTELGKLNARQRELKGAVEQGAKAQRDKNEADKDAIVTSEQLRRESGKRMEAERKAGDAAMQRRRKESSDAQRDMGAMEGFFGGVLSRAREGAAALSREALAAFDAIRGINSAPPAIDTGSLDDTAASLGRVTQALAQVRADLARPMTGPITRWMLETQEASLKTQVAFLGQKRALQSLMKDYESGGLSAQKFIARANGMRRAMSLLDGADLSALNSAIAAAEQRMQQMHNSTRSTLESLQDELDQLQGRTEDIERRRFAARRRELEAQLAEANAGGDSQAVANASRALGMLRQVEAEAEQQRQREAQQKRMEQNQAAAPAAPTEQPPQKVIRLELAGKSVDVAVADDRAETTLLGILEQAALRSTY